ncbi:Oidioi.mRNA.OKI2018_I69.chr2.g4868.t1.cds [Oikopleura dioica]|uniref:Oidioi.mRNA.OKI2018_I69.chr2.g4868.t1.cds n=1 Tax=Oikopleura dioica TaxID=34765 RepID=A0ABN7SYM1_OIKDI|nr:Oidioi.mRNA.OKI2018_I69.chr2.g4868.t1.cds [Oikopleura dioica]
MDNRKFGGYCVKFQNIKIILDRICTHNKAEGLIIETMYRNADLERDNYALIWSLYEAQKENAASKNSTEPKQIKGTEMQKSDLKDAEEKIEKLLKEAEEASKEIEKRKLAEKEINSKASSLQRRIDALKSEGEQVAVENGRLRELLQEEKTENQFLKREIETLKKQDN